MPDPRPQQPSATAAAGPEQQSAQEQEREAALQAERTRFAKWTEEKRKHSQRAGPAAGQADSAPSAAPQPQQKKFELSESGRNRVEQRHAELRELDREQKLQNEERTRLQRMIGPEIQRRLGQLSYLQLCCALNTECRLSSNASKEELKKMLKATMVRYHPDRTRHLELRQRIEAEEIFCVLQTAYKELV